MTDTYGWRSGREHLLRHGAGSPVTLLVLPALFEEANRMRRFTVSVMRELARNEIGTILPDLPGTGESEIALADVTLADWRDAVFALSGNVLGSIAFRGGALLDEAFEHRWRLAPESGKRLMRDMVRATALSAGTSAREIDAKARSGATRLAGNIFSPMLYKSLCDAQPVAGSHDATIEGKKLWRAAEPDDDAEFVRLVAQDITTWVATCGA